MIVIKTKEQIDGIRASCRLAAACLDYIEPFMKPRVTTDAIDVLLDEYIRSHGATSACLGYRGYPKSSCISINEVVCHGIPSGRELLEGDIVNVDVTTILNGFYGDTSRMYKIGSVSQLADRLVTVTKEALAIGIGQIRPGNHFGDIGDAIADYANAKGFSVVYQFCGHGTGLQFHEEPSICHIDRKGTGAVMRPGMTFTVEPMLNQQAAEAKILSDGWTAVTIDGGLSAQFEHTVLVTEDGVEILTQ